ncbi:DUF2515 family protein [Candidatus Viridilinea mediisalina]|uniref:Uncharacterized protein n=1 Tax=Candidatus Viridilinea mediisalina TaxID=2024553 RepID=A0A2A6RDU3_9CHLR|nr:hypothetical protein [Candidatus Viridilinea mediisalina]PDW00821.1 hypothetical protein CJ255_20155 [Candidatus Viridilinea mediisalina]
MYTREEWHAQLERQLSQRTTRIARNQGITQCYARWYLQEPWLFKWAGMAAFASAQVGIALAAAEVLDAPHGLVRPLAEQQPTEGSVVQFGMAAYGQALNLLFTVPLLLHDATARPLLLNDLELIREANNAIFADVGWAHLAYLNGGLKAVEAAIGSDQQAILEAFRMLDEGAHLMCDPANHEQATALIRRAATTMLHREQMVILPPFMDRMSNQGKLLASFGSWLDFEGTPALIGQPSFNGYFGPLALVSGQRSVCNAEDRWSWIEHDLLPRWATLDSNYSERSVIHRRLVALANAQPNLVQMVASMIHRLYPTLALRTPAR